MRGWLSLDLLFFSDHYYLLVFDIVVSGSLFIFLVVYMHLLIYIIIIFWLTLKKIIKIFSLVERPCFNGNLVGTAGMMVRFKKALCAIVSVCFFRHTFVRC